MARSFAVSGQHYLFTVQAFARTVLIGGGASYEHALRDRQTAQVIEDVATGASELGVLFLTSENERELSALIEGRGLAFTELAASAPRVALPASHPLVNAKRLTLEELSDFPYVCFEQDDPRTFLCEEALAGLPRSRRVTCTDRASLSELICALNGYTVTSGILVGISDGSLLTTVPLECDVTLRLGYVSRAGEGLSELGGHFVDALRSQLVRYARA